MIIDFFDNMVKLLQLFNRYHHFRHRYNHYKIMPFSLHGNPAVVGIFVKEDTHAVKADKGSQVIHGLLALNFSLRVEGEE
jgi:hypothetical protein